MVFFDFDQATISPSYYGLLEDLARVLKLNPTLKIRIIGSADAKGSNDYNYKLGLRRAEAVKKFLVSRGVNPAQLVVVSVGETLPLAGNDTEVGRAQNRHVRFEIIR